MQPEQVYLQQLHHLLDGFLDELRRMRCKLTMDRGPYTELAQKRNWELGADNHRLRRQVYNLKKEVNRLKSKYEGGGQEPEEPEVTVLHGVLGRGRYSLQKCSAQK